MEQKNEVSLDIGRFFQIILARKKVVIPIITVCTVLSAIVAFISPKQYSSTALVQMRQSSSLGAASMDAAALASMVGIDAGSTNASPTSYIELMQSRRVLDPIIDSID